MTGTEVKALPRIVECHLMADDYDFLLRVVAAGDVVHCGLSRLGLLAALEDHAAPAATGSRNFRLDP